MRLVQNWHLGLATVALKHQELGALFHLTLLSKHLDASAFHERMSTEIDTLDKDATPRQTDISPPKCLRLLSMILAHLGFSFGNSVSMAKLQAAISRGNYRAQVSYYGHMG